jgi:hypothetical protein
VIYVLDPFVPVLGLGVLYREIVRGSLVSRLVRELPGIDIRVVADRALREEGRPGPRCSRPGSSRSWSGLAVAVVRRRRRPDGRRRAGRILVPFTGGELDPTVLSAAIRIARAEDATLVPAYLIVVPLELMADAPMQRQVTVAMPLLEAVEHAALRAGVPSTRGSRAGGRRSTGSSGCGESSASTGSSSPLQRAVHPASPPGTSPGCSRTRRVRAHRPPRPRPERVASGPLSRASGRTRSQLPFAERIRGKHAILMRFEDGSGQLEQTSEQEAFQWQTTTLSPPTPTCLAGSKRRCSRSGA